MISQLIEKLKNDLRLAHQENLRLKKQQKESTTRANDLREENERLRRALHSLTKACSEMHAGYSIDRDKMGVLVNQSILALREESNT